MLITNAPNIYPLYGNSTKMYLPLSIYRIILIKAKCVTCFIRATFKYMFTMRGIPEFDIHLTVYPYVVYNKHLHISKIFFGGNGSRPYMRVLFVTMLHMYFDQALLRSTDARSDPFVRCCKMGNSGRQNVLSFRTRGYEGHVMATL